MNGVFTIRALVPLQGQPKFAGIINNKYAAMFLLNMSAALGKTLTCQTVLLKVL